MRKEIIAILTIAIIQFTVGQTVFGQFNIKLPEITKIGKPKTDPGKTGNGRENVTTNNGKIDQPKTGGKNIYPNMGATSTPRFMRQSVYVQAVTHNEYWKMKGQENYSSWVPKLRFDHFYTNEKALNYSVEYFNPDGSAWYSEKLVQSSTSSAERTVDFQSPSPWVGILDTKSTAAVGVFGFKIVNDDTKEILYQGKFKVGKFSTANGRPSSCDWRP